MTHHDTMLNKTVFFLFCPLSTRTHDVGLAYKDAFLSPVNAKQLPKNTNASEEVLGIQNSFLLPKRVVLGSRLTTNTFGPALHKQKPRKRRELAYSLQPNSSRQQWPPPY